MQRNKNNNENINRNFFFCDTGSLVSVSNSPFAGNVSSSGFTVTKAVRTKIVLKTIPAAAISALGQLGPVARSSSCDGRVDLFMLWHSSYGEKNQ